MWHTCSLWFLLTRTHTHTHSHANPVGGSASKPDAWWTSEGFGRKQPYSQRPLWRTHTRTRTHNDQPHINRHNYTYTNTPWCSTTVTTSDQPGSHSAWLWKHYSDQSQAFSLSLINTTILKNRGHAMTQHASCKSTGCRQTTMHLTVSSVKSSSGFQIWNAFAAFQMEYFYFLLVVHTAATSWRYKSMDARNSFKTLREKATLFHYLATCTALWAKFCNPCSYSSCLHW